MSQKYATVKVNDHDGLLYPVGSDTPIPADTVIVTSPGNFNVEEGDILVDASGKPWMVQFDPEAKELYCMEVAEPPFLGIDVTDIEAPYVIVYRKGEPIDLMVEA